MDILVQITYHLGKHRILGTRLRTTPVQYTAGHSFLRCLILLSFSIRSLIAQFFGFHLGKKVFKCFILNPE